jgi:Rad3-related DNA helicase
MKYIKTHAHLSSGKNSDPAQEYYENMCMNAVNQSIGRYWPFVLREDRIKTQ